MVDLRRCSRQALEAWRSCVDVYVPLPIAAALAFHAGQECADGLLPERVYEVGLNVAAAWLSRRVAVYIISDSKLQTEIDIAPGSGQFKDGGTVFEPRPGGRITSLGVERAQLATAVEYIRSAGQPMWILRNRKKAAVHFSNYAV